MYDKFVYVFNEEDKDYLLKMGYKLFKEEKNKDKDIYVFLNDVSKIEFIENKEGEFLFTNRLYF